MSVQDNISPELERIRKVTTEIMNTKLKVGIMASEGSIQWIIGMVHEYGASIKVTPKMRNFLHYKGLHLKETTTHINIPERSFIRAGYEEAKPELEKLIQRLIPLVISGKMPVNQMFETLGVTLSTKIQTYVKSVRTPPNHPMTIARKGSSQPLVDSGRMVQSITYEVVKV